jgi:hypothetical protein
MEELDQLALSLVSSNESGAIDQFGGFLKTLALLFRLLSLSL